VSQKTNIDRKTRTFISSMSGRGGKGTKVRVNMTNLAKDLDLLDEELLKKVCPTAVGYAGTIVRKQVVQNIRSGGGEKHIGMSRKTGTRKKWSRKVVKSRGVNGPSLGDKGTVIKKNISRKAGGLMSSQIVGPKYDSGDTAKNFAHTHEPREGQFSGAPNHKWWPRKRMNLSNLLKRKWLVSGRETTRRGAPLKPRPFMEPAASQTMNEQEAAIFRALERWEIDFGEINGTTGEFG
jgi:hypothetical protein